MTNLPDSSEPVKPKSRAQLCKACKAFVLPLITKKGNHWRADCPECKKYIKFIGKKDAPNHNGPAPAPVKKVKFKQPKTREQLRESCLTLCKTPTDYWSQAARFLDDIGTCARHILTPRQQAWLLRIEQQIAKTDRQEKIRDTSSKVLPLRKTERYS